MQNADTLKIRHADDRVTQFTDVRYHLGREYVEVVENDGTRHGFSDVVDSQATRAPRQR